MIQDTQTLVDPKNGHLAFKIFGFESNIFFDHLQRNNYYSLIWIQQGAGQLKADFSEYHFTDNNLLAFSPYQPFMLMPRGNVVGVVIHFHPDFFCIHKHQKEVACDGVLFNNIYNPPVIAIDNATEQAFELLTGQMQAEMHNAGLAQYEMLVSYLKIFLITASRLKAKQFENQHTSNETQKPFILQSLKEAIEAKYKEKHAVTDYADLLNITSKALAKVVKSHLNKSVSSLISERIIIEAKRELYLTNKPVKQIASELGYEDEYYFSRFFKTNTNISPQLYRNTVGFDRLAGLSVN